MTQAIGTRSTSQWLGMFQDGDAALAGRLEELYEPQRAENRRDCLLRLIGEHRRLFGEQRRLGAVRAPGRLNTLGRHADHRGAYTNPVSLEWEVMMVFSPREDDRFAFHNVEDQFGNRSFALSEFLPAAPPADLTGWLEWTGALANQRLMAGTRNDWVHKLASIPVYAQTMLAPAQRIRGMDAVLAGDVPRAVGLSSSSAVVMVMMEAVLATNDLRVDPAQFILHAGRAEWYVGTRGGFGDHAGIKFGRKGRITHLRSEPKLDVKAHLPFCSEHCFVIFHSGFEADKTGEAGQRFNEKTATFATGELYLRRWLKAHHGELFDRLWQARDGQPEEKRIYMGDLVGVLGDEEIFALLAETPVRITRAELRRRWPDRRDLLERLFSSHAEPLDGYAIQAVLTYGLSEVARCARAPELLHANDMAGFGAVMNASHDGDRVTVADAEVAALKAAADASLPLWRNLGDYACSTPQIDRMCDIALAAGAVGAQLSGAGCGGSMMALVAADRVEEVITRMDREYFTPQNVPARQWVVRPASGSGMI